MGDVAAHFGHSALSKVIFLHNRDNAFAIGRVKCKIWMACIIINVLVAIIDVFCHSGQDVFITHAVQFNLTSSLHRDI